MDENKKNIREVEELDDDALDASGGWSLPDRAGIPPEPVKPPTIPVPHTPVTLPRLPDDFLRLHPKHKEDKE